MNASEDNESLYGAEYSKLWKELIHGLSGLDEFKDATTPFAIISIINTLVTECSMQMRNGCILTKLMEKKTEDIETRKRTEETLKVKIASLNSIIENNVKCNGNISTHQLRELETKCQHLELENEELKTQQSQNCPMCPDLKQKCNMLQLENAQYEKEISCRHDALLYLQNNLQPCQSSEYPEEFEDKNKQLKVENQLLKEQLAQCHNITLEMQKKYLKPVELSDKVQTLQSKCNSLELENKQLVKELSSKHDAEASLIQKDIQLQEYSRKLKTFQNKCKEWEKHSCISQTEEGLNQSELEEMRRNQVTAGIANAMKLKELKERVFGIELEMSQLEEQISKENKAPVSVLDSPSEDVFVNVTDLQKRYDLLETTNKELTDQLQELNEKLSENNIVHAMLSGNLSSTSSEIEEDECRYDRTVVLKPKDERGTYGIWFGRKRGPLTSRESKFYIATINNSSPEAKILRSGDFVIKVNGVNVQQASTTMVNHILRSSFHTDLTLVVRNYVREHIYRTISGGKSVGNDWGITLGVFVKEICHSSFARKLGLHEYDEIVKVNNQCVPELNLTQIYNKMNKYVRFEIQRTKDALFNLPDIIFNHLHIPTVDEYALNNSDESLYVTSGFGSMHAASSPDVNLPIQTESRYLSYSTSTLLSNNRTFAPGDACGSSSTVELVINKEYKSFGWKLIGGNTTGIYIKMVYSHLPACDAGVQEGWKLLQIEGYNLQNVALSFAHDIINSLQKKKTVKVVFEKIDYELYNERINKLPHDCFHVRALADYNNGGYSFKRGDVFCVKNSYFIEHEDGDIVKWEATASGSYGRDLEVVIPSQRAKIIVIQEEPEKNTWRRSTKNKTDFYYDILDDVDIVYSETDGLLRS